MNSMPRIGRCCVVLPLVCLVLLAGCHEPQHAGPACATLVPITVPRLQLPPGKERDGIQLALETAAHCGVRFQVLDCSYSGPAAELLVWWEVVDEGNVIRPHGFFGFYDCGPIVGAETLLDAMKATGVPLSQAYYVSLERTPVAIPLPAGEEVHRRVMYSFSDQGCDDSEASYARFVVTCGGGHATPSGVVFAGLVRFPKALAYHGAHGMGDRLKLGETVTVWSHMFSAATKPCSIDDLYHRPLSVEFRLRAHLRPAGATTGWPPETRPAG